MQIAFQNRPILIRFWKVVLVSFFSIATLGCEEQYVASSDPKLRMLSGVMLYENSLFKGTIVSEIPALEETQYTTFDNGIQHGDFKVIHKTGLLLQKIPFRNGKQNGVSRTWFLNGKDRSYSEFKDGYYINERMEWYDNGNLALYETFDSQGKILASKRFYREGKIYMNLVFQPDGSSYGLVGSKNCNPLSQNLDIPNVQPNSL